MKKTFQTSALLLSGLMAAGIAQAETYDTPQQAGEASTMTMGAPNQLTTNSPYGGNSVVVDTTVLGAPATVYSYSYVPDTVVTHVYRPELVSRNASAATFNVPSRAGEASTMTGGAPNMVTDNSRVILQSNHPVIVY
jgi:hypothetical protein